MKWDPELRNIIQVWICAWTFRFVGSWHSADLFSMGNSSFGILIPILTVFNMCWIREHFARGCRKSFSQWQLNQDFIRESSFIGYLYTYICIYIHLYIYIYIHMRKCFSGGHCGYSPKASLNLGNFVYGSKHEIMSWNLADIYQGLNHCDRISCYLSVHGYLYNRFIFRRCVRSNNAP